ncbi:uncharacterized protein EV420DRAFT_1488358 [Desarmillaria tabescens]|uniref:Uncharacterized protein n=1 Tax=Armillaria tabescens TaxID=1929756 RepID=A0AA39MIM9_ARMTA|nr:uncharacterized protein EV420DRAFT_1488358 [Desarmillaria tabescens]KAK0434855.1 hypothetical protein EV420DRAFT_1488358 [Desarmillaria tabescens]
MATQLEMDFSVLNPHLYKDPSDRLPRTWCNDWENFPSSRRLFPLVNGRISASVDIELLHHISGKIYVIMFHGLSDEAVIRISTWYFMYNFEMEILLEFIDTYPMLDAFLDLARQWGSLACQTYTELTPFVEREVGGMPDNYYDEVKRWKEEVKKARAAQALMSSCQSCYL